MEELEETIEAIKKVTPNPAKQERCKLKSQKRKLKIRRDMIIDHKKRLLVCGKRNSYSKNGKFYKLVRKTLMKRKIRNDFNFTSAISFFIGSFVTVSDSKANSKTLPVFLAKEKLERRGLINFSHELQLIQTRLSYWTLEYGTVSSVV